MALRPATSWVVASRSNGEPVVYAVPAVANGFAVLSQSVDGSTLTLPQGDVRIRVTRSITGVGDAYEFVGSVRGWGHGSREHRVGLDCHAEPRSLASST